MGDGSALARATMPVICSPEKFFAVDGIPIFQLARSRMGNAAARLRHPIAGRHGPMVVEVRKDLVGDARTWSLWHEAAHAVDCATKVSAGIWEGHPSIGGYGRVSIQLVGGLRAHADFIVKLSPIERVWRIKCNGRVYGFEDLQADPTVNPLTKARCRARAARASFRDHIYKSSGKELFAEAIAGAICAPSKLEAGAPGLIEALRQATENMGFPL